MLFRSAGFTDIDIEVIRTYGPEDVVADAKRLIQELGIEPASVEGLYGSALVRARKPAR